MARSFFHSELGTRQLGGGLVAWRGYYQSLRPTQSGLSLNLGKGAKIRGGKSLLSNQGGKVWQT